MKIMKKIILFLFFTSGVYSSTYLNAQVPDTLRYLRQIVANKSLYVNHPFSKLEDSLVLSIQNFTPITPLKNINLEQNAIFGFYYSSNIDEMIAASPALIVVWETMPIIQNSYRFFYQDNRGKYPSAVSQYYRPFIIKDIYLIE
ncbi:MAG: hypothetical protein EAY68_06885 [Bacteroidetes bacterium]|nr:MAG: hypothetical protein EAY68_06885 [Bacteroidota bacterium]